MNFRNQSRWDDYGKNQLSEIKKAPSKFVIKSNPLLVYPELERVCRPFVIDIKDKKVLEIGCGRGELSVYLASKGAKMTGSDIGSSLVEASRMLAQINKSPAKFITCSATNLPFRSETFNIVFCVAVLHHLDQKDVEQSLKEIFRVLRKGGICILNEAIEDSPTFDFMQNLFPLRKKSTGEERPSILSRRKWKTYLSNLDERAMTTKELRTGLSNFSEVSYHYHGLFDRFDRFFPQKKQTFQSIDKKILKSLPYIRRFSRSVIIIAKK